MQYFPLFYDLNGKPVLVVGGGEVASRKVEMLVRAGAKVTVVSPNLSTMLAELVKLGDCQWIKQCYSEELLDSYIQVWATTNSAELNHLVHKHAKSRGVMVNVVDDKPYCDFITPSVINRGKIQVAISSGGASPILVRNIRQKIEVALSQNLAIQADFVSSKRQEVKNMFSSVDERKRFWERYFNHNMTEHADCKEQLEKIYQNVIKEGNNDTVSLNWVEFGSNVELLSLKTLRIMQQADVVYYPSVCPFEFIDLCRRDANRYQYQDKLELDDYLIKASDMNVGTICIFIPKDTYNMQGNMPQNAVLLKVVG